MNSTKTIDDIINQKRETAAEFHLQTAQAWRRIGQKELKHTPLVYAAFEYRCAIERIVFELYYFIKGTKLPHKEAESISSFKELIELVHTHAGGTKKDLYLMLKFNQIYTSELLGLKKEMSIPDVGKLHKYWSKLSEYCHLQLIPSNTWNSKNWVENGYSLLEKVEAYLWDIAIDKYFGSLSIDTIPQEMKEQRNLFLNGELTEAALRTRLRIMKPVIEARAKNKIERI